VAEYAVETLVSPEFFRVLAVQPAIGRLFRPEESVEGAGGAALISDRFARQEFGDPRLALGRTLRIGNRSVPIAGVLPAMFDFPTGTDIWFPLESIRGPGRQHRRGNNFRAVARLNDTVTLEGAQAEMTAISDRLATEYPDTNRDIRVLVTPLQSDMVSHVEPTLYLLLGAVGLVLLTACATMATLLLVKTTTRAPEVAVRVALGASRSRIMKQSLVEALIHGLTAGTIGILLAVWGTRALVALSPPEVPRLDEVAVNGRVLLFTSGLCLLVSVLFGLSPALQAARVVAIDPLRHSTNRSTGGFGRGTRETLVVVEIALAVVLVITGVLCVRSVVALQHVPLGFDPARVLMVQATAPARLPNWTDSRAFFREFLADVAAIPGVIRAGAMMGPPGRVSAESGYWIDRIPTESPLSVARPAVMNVIAPRTFAALGVPFRQGRDFEERDGLSAPKVAIINEALARASFRGEDPVGRIIFAAYVSTDPMTVVGVVGDIRQHGPAREPQPEIYMPYQQQPYNGATLYVVVKTATDPASLGPTLVRKAQERLPQVSLQASTLEALLAEHVATPRFRAWLFSLFAAVALCLALAGVYGVMAYVAAQRSKEIGVRMALGASAHSVVGMMLGRGGILTAIGVATGVLAALACSRLVSGLLFEVQPTDVGTYLAVVAMLGVFSLAATYVPARRATQIDPLAVLRQD
jgi:predicted permease